MNKKEQKNRRIANAFNFASLIIGSFNYLFMNKKSIEDIRDEIKDYSNAMIHELNEAVINMEGENA